MAIRVFWIVWVPTLVLVAAIGTPAAQAQPSGSGPCTALRLRLKVRRANPGAVRVGHSTIVTLTVTNSGQTPVIGVGVKLALSNGLCPIVKSSWGARGKQPPVIEAAGAGGGFNMYWDSVRLGEGKKRRFLANAKVVVGQNATIHALRVDGLVYLAESDGTIQCSVAAAPVQVGYDS